MLLSKSYHIIFPSLGAQGLLVSGLQPRYQDLESGPSEPKGARRSPLVRGAQLLSPANLLQDGGGEGEKEKKNSDSRRFASLTKTSCSPACHAYNPVGG